MLNEQEKRALELIAEGKSIETVACMMDVSKEALASCISNACDKYQWTAAITADRVKALLLGGLR